MQIQCGTDKSQAYAQISAGGFNHRSAGREQAARERIFNIRPGRSILDGASGVAHFQFDVKLRPAFAGKFFQMDEGSAPHSVQRVHNMLSLDRPVPAGQTCSERLGRGISGMSSPVNMRHNTESGRTSGMTCRIASPRQK